MVENLSEDKFNFLRATFEIYEENGSIPTKKLRMVMNHLGENPSNEELEQMIKEVDLDGNGKIDYEEFLYLVNKIRTEPDLEEKKIYAQAFNFLDENNKGYLTIPELKKLMIEFDETLSADEIEELIKIADFNGDGKFSSEDYIKILMNK